MNALGLVFLLLLTLTGTTSEQDVVPMTTLTCANRRGYCRRFCLSHEVHVGHYGCPRHYRCCVPKIYLVEWNKPRSAKSISTSTEPEY